MVLHWQLAYMQSVCEVVWLRCLLIKTRLTKFLSFKAFRVELLRAFVPLSAAQWGPGRCSRYGRWSGSWGPYIPCWYPGLHSASPPPVCSSCWPHCPAGLERQSYHTAESGGEKGDGCGSGKKKQTNKNKANKFFSFWFWKCLQLHSLCIPLLTDHLWLTYLSRSFTFFGFCKQTDSLKFFTEAKQGH